MPPALSPPPVPSAEASVRAGTGANMCPRVRVKICGVRDVPTALAAARLGADAIGLVFWSPSPRAVEVVQAAAIARALPPFVARVGLFVDAPVEEIARVLAQVPLDYLQLQGAESPAWCAALPQALGTLARPWIKAVTVRGRAELVTQAHDYARAGAAALLCDAGSPSLPGGTGACFDWDLLPEKLPLPWILAGGLSAGRVGEAIRRCTPWAVDVSSGVESARGVKDLARIADFIDAVHRTQGAGG